MGAPAARGPINKLPRYQMSEFYAIPLSGSIDSLTMVKNCNAISNAAELGFESRPGRFAGSLVWFDNGIRETHEPRVTLYQTWAGIWRVKAELSIPKLLFGNNVDLPTSHEIDEAITLASNNISHRTKSNFDSFSAQVARVDFALNIQCEYSSALLAYFSRSKIPNLTRRTVESTVYFQNKSRGIRLYDKYAETVAMQRDLLALQDRAAGIVRAEYFLSNTTSVNRFAKRSGYEEGSVGTVTSKSFIEIATRELTRLLTLDAIDLSGGDTFRKILLKTGSVKKAIALSGFLNAVTALGENFYKDLDFEYSKSTYDRNRRDCQLLGFISL
jgi:hypothetical protein